MPADEQSLEQSFAESVFHQDIENKSAAVASAISACSSPRNTEGEQVPQYVVDLRWDKLFHSLESSYANIGSDLRHFVRPPKEEVRWEAALRLLVVRAFHDAQRCIKDAGQYYLRIMGNSGPVDMNATSTHRWRQIASPEGINKYILLGVQIYLAVILAATDSDDKYRKMLGLSESQARLAIKLKEELEWVLDPQALDQPSLINDYDAGDSSDDIYWLHMHDDFENDYEYDEGDEEDDDDYDSHSGIEGSAVPLPSESESASKATTAFERRIEALLELLQDLGESLWVQSCPVDTAEWIKFPIYRLFAFVSYQAKQQSFKRLCLLRPISAPIVYWCRLTVNNLIQRRLTEVKAGMQQSCDGGYSDLDKQRIDAEIAKYHYFVQDNVATPCGAMLGAAGLLKDAAQRAGISKTLLWDIDSNNLAVLMKGQRVALQDISRVMFTAFTKADQLLQENILMHMPLSSDETNKLSSLHGQVFDAANESDTSSFLDHSRNGFEQYSSRLPAHLVFAKRFAVPQRTSGSATKLRWSKSKLKDWMRSVAKFQDYLAMLIHISSGQPSRCTELATLAIRSKGYAPRNIFVLDNAFTFVTGYSKSRSLTRKDNVIARYLPKEFSGLLLKYFALVRPMEIIAAEELYSGRELDIARDSYKHALFVKNGKKVKGSSIRMMFPRLWREINGYRLSILSYRHVARAFAVHWISKFGSTFENHWRATGEESNHANDTAHSSAPTVLLEAQMNHNVQTANTYYGISQQDLQLIEAYREHGF
ncbi:hypothetical protein GGI12_005229, partial [Dipsacomyces acuminosporus]